MKAHDDFLAAGAGMLVLFLASFAAAAEPEAMDAAELVRKVQADEQWIEDVESLLLRADIRMTRTREGRAAEFKKLARQFDVAILTPDRFAELRPESRTTLEVAFDARRVGYRVDTRGVAQWTHVWERETGKLTTRERYALNDPPQEHVAFAAEPSFELRRPFAHLAWPRISSGRFWWIPPEEREALRESSTPAEDYVHAGRRQFEGAQCDVLVKSSGWGVLYVGSDDGRLRGMRQGAMTLPTLEALKSLGHSFASQKEALAWFQKVQSERSADERDAFMKKLNVALQMQEAFVPVFEMVFRDYRELERGGFIPMTQVFRGFGSDDGERGYLASWSDIRITEARVNAELPDDLFAVEIPEGVEVHDQTHDPPLIYRHKAEFTPEEWQEIIDEARQRQSGR